MFFGNPLKKIFEPKLRDILRNHIVLSGCEFSILTERDFITGTSDSLGEYLLLRLGGNYEGSISLTYYKGGDLTVECYFSNARARSIGLSLESAVNKYGKLFDRAESTRYRPGDSSMSFSLGLCGIGEHDFKDAAERLLAAATCVLEEVK